jgi:hypothetical protein
MASNRKGRSVSTEGLFFLWAMLSSFLIFSYNISAGEQITYFTS